MQSIKPLKFFFNKNRSSSYKSISSITPIKQQQIKVIAFALILLATSIARASALHNEIPHQDLLTYTYRDDGSKEAVIKGRRYLNPETGLPNTNGKKILLTHGFMSTPHEFDHMVDYFLLGEKKRSPLSQLIKEGFDIYTFAFRGHGVGPENEPTASRSHVLEYQTDDYKFEKQFKDFAAMIELIQATAKQEGVRNAQARKVSVIGHSMGGMVATAATATMPELRKYIQIIVNIQSPNDFKTDYDDAEVGILSPEMGRRIYTWILESQKPYPLVAPPKHSSSFYELMRKFIFSEKLRAVAELTRVGKKLLEVARFGVKSGSAVHRDLLLSMVGFGVNNHYPYKGLDPQVPVVNLYGGEDTIAPKNSIIEQAQLIHNQGGKVWLLEVETAGHLDVVFPGHLNAYMLYIMTALKDPNLLGEPGSHIRVEQHEHYVPMQDCARLLD